jgi:biotin carboxyl carrier protein
MTKYIVSDGSRDWTVQVENSPDGTTIKIGDRTYQVDVARPGASTFSLLVEGRAYDAVVTRREGRHHVQVGSHSYVLEVLDERQRLLRDQKLAAAAAGPMEVSSSMPGRVVTVLVEEGQEVAQGQGVVVLEAMKMENELKAPKAGRVREVCVSAGQTTEAGQPLVIIE